MRSRDWRRSQRYTKGMRRILEDRAQHGQSRTCICFGTDGKTFSRFADTPTPCGCRLCANPRRWAKGIHRFTIQELRVAADVLDIDLSP